MFNTGRSLPLVGTKNKYLIVKVWVRVLLVTWRKELRATLSLFEAWSGIRLEMAAWIFFV
jgi:hypothetical protein